MKDGLTQVKELKDKIHEQYIEIQELNKENDRLNNIINNAIKGIEDYYYGDEEYKKYDYTLAYQIYHILKGDGKE